MKTIDEILKGKASGLHYGNRVILPFVGDVVKLIIENDIITDFGPASKGAFIKERENHMDIYFLDYKSLSAVVSKYETIKLVIVEKGKDIFNFDNHRRLALRIKEKHLLEIEEIEDDILFIE